MNTRFFLMGFDGAQDTFYTTKDKVISRVALQGGVASIKYFDSEEEAKSKAEEIMRREGTYLQVNIRY